MRKKWIAGALIIGMLLQSSTMVSASGVGAFSGNGSGTGEMNISSTTIQLLKEDETEYAVLSGCIYTMGYEFDVEAAVLGGSFTVEADNGKEKQSVKTVNGKYELTLVKGETYALNFKGYVSGRIANMNVTVENLSVDDDTEMNVVVRTKRVLGLGQPNAHPCPENSLIVRDLKSAILLNDKIKILPEKVKVNTRSNETRPNLIAQGESGLIYPAGFTYTSSDPEIAEVDENGKIIPKKKGTVTITGVFSGDSEISGTSQIEVVSEGGFDPAKDGFCFSNSKNALYLDPIEDSFVKDAAHHILNDGAWYPIPYARYQSIGSTLGSLEYFLIYCNKSWGGNCFGMSAVAALLYNGKLDAESFGMRKYDTGETINEGAYDGAVKSGAGEFYYAVAGVKDGKVSQLTAKIEEFQIWQEFSKCGSWEKENEVSLEKVLSDWETGKTYLVVMHGISEDGKRFDHCVVLDTHGEQPVKNSQGKYILPVYDCNFPAFTDETNDYYDKLPHTTKSSVEVDGDAASFKIESANNQDEASQIATGSDIKFFDAEKLPAKIENVGNFVEKNTAGCYRVCAGDTWKMTANSGDQETVVYELVEGVVKTKAEDLEIRYLSGSGSSEMSEYIITYDSDDVVFDFVGRANVYNAQGENATGADVGDSSRIHITGNRILVENKNETEVMLLTKSEKDGKEVAVLTSLVSPAENQIDCSLGESRQYSITSRQDVTTSVAVENEEGVKTAELSVGFEGKPIDIVEYVNQTLVDKEIVFADVEMSEDNWQYKVIKYAYDKNLMKGKDVNEDGSIIFDPNGNITRAEFAQVLYNIEGKPTVEYRNIFTDVPEGKWFSNAVIWAYENGIVKGKGNGLYDVSGLATREEIATMFKKYAALKNFDVTASGDISGFTDEDSISSWAVDNIKWAVGHNVMKGKGTRIDPLGKATRAECAAMLSNFDATFVE